MRINIKSKEQDNIKFEGSIKVIPLLGVFLCVGLAIRVYISWLDLETLFQKVLVDDAFFYMKLAQNIASGNGVTFDGEILTNGFHLVYAMLLVPLFWVFPHNLEIPIHCALTILSVFNVLTGIVIFLIIREISGRVAGLIAFFIWLFNPYVIMISLSGVEVGVATFFLSLCIYQYIKMLNSGIYYPARFIILGILTALAILSRTDSVFMFVAITFHILYLSFRQKKKLISSLSKPTLYVLTTFAILSPWFIWNLYHFGTIRQISGVVLPFTAHTMYLIKYKTYFSLSFIKMELFYLKTWVSHIITFGGGPVLVFLALGFLGGVLFSLKERRNKLIHNINLLNFSIISVCLTVCFYALYFWGWLRPWYYLSILPVVTIYLGLVLSMLQEKIKGWSIKGLFIVCFLLFINFSYLGYTAWREGLFPFQKQMYDATIWIEQNTEEDARIGAFNSGIFGYLSNRKVIDLAGVVNQDVYKARLEKRLYDYFMEKKLDYLIDRQDMVEFNQIFSKTDYVKNLKLIKRFGPTPADISVYKFTAGLP